MQKDGLEIITAIVVKLDKKNLANLFHEEYVSILARIASQGSLELSSLAVRILSQFFSGDSNDWIIQLAISQGIYGNFYNILTNSKSSTLSKEVLWGISNMTACQAEIAETLLDEEDLLKYVIVLIQTDGSDLGMVEQGMWTLSNLILSINPHRLRQFMEKYGEEFLEGFVRRLYKVPESQMDLVACSLEAMIKIVNLD